MTDPLLLNKKLIPVSNINTNVNYATNNNATTRIEIMRMFNYDAGGYI
jgi:hypothetical protein